MENKNKQVGNIYRGKNIGDVLPTNHKEEKFEKVVNFCENGIVFILACVGIFTIINLWAIILENFFASKFGDGILEIFI